MHGAGEKQADATCGDGRAERERVGKLKWDIALDRYDVDSDAVAGAILSKMILLRRARRALSDPAADRSPTGSALRPQPH